jgi:ferric-dicitrate binding protein FerR (iron transport regulator)
MSDVQTYYAEVGLPDADPARGEADTRITGPFHADDPDELARGLTEERGEDLRRLLTEDEYIDECDAGLHG